MDMKSHCPACGNVITVTSESVGKVGRCDKCHSLLKIQKTGSLRVITTETSRKPVTGQSPIWARIKFYALAAAGIGCVAFVVALSVLWFVKSGGVSRDSGETKRLLDLKADLQDRDAEVERLEAKIERLEHEARVVPRLRGQIAVLEKERKDANGALRLARNQIRDREAELATSREEIRSLTDRLDKARKEKNEDANSFRTTLFSVKARNNQLDSKVLALRRQVNSLQAKLTAQEDKDVAEQKQPRWKNRENWRRLRKGMTKAQVKAILGPPGKIRADDYYGDTWYYPDVLDGEVSFDGDSERVDGWEEP